MQHGHSNLKALVLTGTLAISGLLLPCTAAAQEKYASIVINADTNEVLHARFADAERYPASLTKVMTLYMLFDAIKIGEVALSDQISVSRAADRQPASDLGIKAGEAIGVEEAINALVTKSANDVAVAIAEHLGGSEARFAALMTVKARLLGLESTSFFNASGLPDNRQLTTARDMAILAGTLLETHGDYYHYFSRPKFSWGQKSYRNHNKLLGTVDGVDGIKTGYTRASGFNLMASAKRDGTRIIAVMLGGKTSRARNAHVTELIEAAYTAIDTNTPLTELASLDGTSVGLVGDESIEKVFSVSGHSQSITSSLAPVAEGASDSETLEYRDG